MDLPILGEVPTMDWSARTGVGSTGKGHVPSETCGYNEGETLLEGGKDFLCGSRGGLMGRLSIEWGAGLSLALKALNSLRQENFISIPTARRKIGKRIAY